MTELQKVELDILAEFLRVCETLGLPYYLVCGSCLGAVKYNGFIPWDDDIDVAMKREDYETFLRCAPELLPAHLFLQHYKSDPAVPFLYAKLRDSRTTFIEIPTRKLRIHHGVYIDIFPLDGYPKRRAWLFELRKSVYHLQTICAYEVQGKWITRCFLRLERLLGYHKRTAGINRKREKLLRSVPIEHSDLWCNFGNWQGKLDYAPREWFGEGTEVLFEGLRVRVPLDFDAYLTRKYGDWRAELPKNAQKSHHDWSVCDLDRPYTMYLTDENRQKKTK